eukprot:CAMPEP_0184702664 /NCGR_PEP_ID=MMETSP0313-20130426/25050_1 /TAXON_ID=2792 /ORGANISM="Porphyridium aerugineum, Strain SAG 1380-2" /LENGTH=34 /DNA_ID= /DNA_START= /DNA_END= /DNA_ORIENTATION=
MGIRRTHVSAGFAVDTYFTFEDYMRGDQMKWLVR